MKTPKTITAQVKAKVAKMVEAGKTGAQIAVALGISLPAVQNIKRQLPQRAPVVTVEPDAESELFDHLQHIRDQCKAVQRKIDKGDFYDDELQVVYDLVAEMERMSPPIASKDS